MSTTSAPAFEHVRRVAQESRSSFYTGMRLLPRERRDALFAIYALARRIDDVADGGLPTDEKLERLGSTQELGTWLIYLFFFQIGTEASISRLVQQGSAMFVFCAIMAAANIAFALVLGKLFRCKLEEIAIAINATLGGPPSAAAMAIAKGWPTLVLPAVLVGVWGYILGQWCGLAVAELLLA